MIDHSDLFHFADELIYRGSPSEAELRRAISSLYYALFHRLAAYGASVFSGGGIGLQNRAARAYNHAQMRKVCESYSRGAGGQFDASLRGIVPSPPSPDILIICDAFVDLQEARHRADYDLAASFSHDEAIELSAVADKAADALTAVKDSSETRIFLTALLFAERWTKRG